MPSLIFAKGVSSRTVLSWMLVLAVATLLATGCSSQGEHKLSALHYFQRGNAAFQAEDFHRAIMHYQRAIEFDDSAPELHYNLGLAYYRVQSYDNAIKAYKRAIELDPDFADAHHNLALAYDKEYNLEAANRHFNLYRDLTAVPMTQPEAQEQPSNDKAGASRAAAKRQNSTPPPRSVPVQRQAAARPQQGNPFEGSGNKWWNVDPAERNR